MSSCDQAADWLKAGREMIASERLPLDMARWLRAGEKIRTSLTAIQDTELEAVLNSPLSFSLLPRRLMLKSIECSYFTRLAACSS